MLAKAHALLVSMLRGHPDLILIGALRRDRFRRLAVQDVGEEVAMRRLSPGAVCEGGSCRQRTRSGALQTPWFLQGLLS